MKKIVLIAFYVFLFFNVFGIGNSLSSKIIKINIDTIKVVNGNDTSFVVEIPPEFPGGTTALIKMIVKNIKYPIEAKNNGVSGTVYLSFVVEKDGSVSNCTVLRGIGYGCDEEAIRVVNNLPKFIPGTQDGRNVRCLFQIPVHFRL